MFDVVFKLPKHIVTTWIGVLLSKVFATPVVRNEVVFQGITLSVNTDRKTPMIHDRE